MKTTMNASKRPSCLRMAPVLPLLGLLAAAGCTPSEGRDSAGASKSEGVYAFDGAFEEVIHDDIDGSVKESSVLRLDEQTAFELDFSESEEAARSLAEQLSSGAALRVHGELVDGRIVVSRLERRAANAEVGTHRQSVVGVGHRTAAVILVGFQGTPNTYDPAAVQNAVFGMTGRTANTFYLEGSRGKMKLIGIQDPEGGDVFGPYTVPHASCNDAGGFGAIGDAARTLANADGANTNAYDHVVHVLAPNNGCPGGGVASGNRYTWLFGIGINGIWDYTAHEVGHNFGLPHAAWYQNCTSRNGSVVTRSGSCTHDEYGDPTDVMGRRNHLFSSYFLERLLWLDESNVLVPEQSRRVMLSPLAVETSGIQSLRVPRPGASGAEAFYHFEYRQPLGEFDSRLEETLTNGVLVRLAGNPHQRSTPRLLDMTPGSRNGGNDTLDAALVAGSSFQDGNLQVDVLAVTPDCVTLDVTLDGVPPDIDDPVGSCGDEEDDEEPGGGADGTGGLGGAGGADGAGASSGTGTTNGMGASDGTGASDGDEGASSGGSAIADELAPRQLEGSCSCRTAPGRQTWSTALLGLLLFPGLWYRRRSLRAPCQLSRREVTLPDAPEPSSGRFPGGPALRALRWHEAPQVSAARWRA